MSRDAFLRSFSYMLDDPYAGFFFYHSSTCYFKISRWDKKIIPGKTVLKAITMKNCAPHSLHRRSSVYLYLKEVSLAQKPLNVSLAIPPFRQATISHIFKHTRVKKKTPFIDIWTHNQSDQRRFALVKSSISSVWSGITFHSLADEK